MSLYYSSHASAGPHGTFAEQQWDGKWDDSGRSAGQQVYTSPVPHNEGIASLHPIHHLILDQLIALVPYKTLQLSRYFYSRTIPSLYRNITPSDDVFKGIWQPRPVALRSYHAFTHTRSVNLVNCDSLFALTSAGNAHMEFRSVFPKVERVEFAWSAIEELSGLQYVEMGEEIMEFALNFGPALSEVVIHVQPPTFKPSEYHLRGRGEGEDDPWDTIDVIVTMLMAKTLTFVVHGDLQEREYRHDLGERLPVRWFSSKTLRVVVLTREIALDSKALQGDRLYLAPNDDLLPMLGRIPTNHPFDTAINRHLLRILYPQFPFIEESYVAEWPDAPDVRGVARCPARIEYHVWGAAAAEKGFRAKPILPGIQKALDDGKVAFVQLEQTLLSERGWEEGLMPGATTWETEEKPDSEPEGWPNPSTQTPQDLEEAMAQMREWEVAMGLALASSSSSSSPSSGSGSESESESESGREETGSELESDAPQRRAAASRWSSWWPFWKTGRESEGSDWETDEGSDGSEGVSRSEESEDGSDGSEDEAEEWPGDGQPDWEKLKAPEDLDELRAWMATSPWTKMTSWRPTDIDNVD